MCFKGTGSANIGLLFIQIFPYSVSLSHSGTFFSQNTTFPPGFTTLAISFKPFGRSGKCPTPAKQYKASKELSTNGREQALATINSVGIPTDFNRSILYTSISGEISNNHNPPSLPSLDAIISESFPVPAETSNTS